MNKQSLIIKLSRLILVAKKADEIRHFQPAEIEVDRLVKECLPSGSGFDAGTSLNWEESDGENKIVFTTSFHHMDDCGGYDGWTEHDVTVTPRFDGIDVQVSGEDRNGILEYIGDTFHDCLTFENG